MSRFYHDHWTKLCIMCYHKKFQLNWLTDIEVTANLLTSLFDVLRWRIWRRIRISSECWLGSGENKKNRIFLWAEFFFNAFYIVDHVYDFIFPKKVRLPWCFFIWKLRFFAIFDKFSRKWAILDLAIKYIKYSLQCFFTPFLYTLGKASSKKDFGLCPSFL